MQPPIEPIRPVEVTQEWVLRKCDYFVDTQLWPPYRELDATRWLDNFEPAELEHAIHLLHSVLFYSAAVTDRLFVAAFQSLSRHIGCPALPAMQARSLWRSFLDTVYITHVTGETPTTSDSGHLFARKARDLLRIPEDRILDNARTLEAIIAGKARHVVFVDDFVGSGIQFRDTWRRPHRLTASTETSFEKASLSRNTRFFYCPVFCTERAMNTVLTTDCARVRVSPAHFLNERYSALSANSLIWPDRLRSTAEAFLHTVSTRAGLPDTGGKVVDDWRGFHALGLTIAFSHGVPDATLPILYTDKNGWKPLFRSFV